MAKAFSVKALIKAKETVGQAARRARNAIKRQLAPALRQVRSLARVANGALRGLNGTLGLLGAAGLAASVGGLAALTRSNAAALDELGKFSRQTKTAVIAIQEWEYTAQRSGASAEAMRAGIKNLSGGMAQMRIRTGELRKWLWRLPPAFRAQFKGAKSTEEATELVIKAMTKIQDPAKRAIFAMKFFGGAGEEIARIAENGADGIEKLRKEAHRYGLATLKDTQAAEAYMDAQLNLERSIAGVKMAIGNALIPVLQPLVEQMTKWAAANRELIAQKVQDTVKAIVGWFKSIDWNQVGASIRGIAYAFRDVKEKINEATDVLGPWVDRIGTYLGESAAKTAIWAKQTYSDLGGTVERISAAWRGGDLAGVIRESLTLAWQYAKAPVKLIGELLEPLIPDAIKEAWRGLKDWFRDLWNDIVGVFDDAIDSLKAPVRWVSNAADTITGVGRDVGNWVGGRDQSIALSPSVLAALNVPNLAPSAPGGRLTDGSVSVDVRIRPEGGIDARTDTKTRGNGVKTRTTTTPTGRSGMAQPLPTGAAL